MLYALMAAISLVAFDGETESECPAASQKYLIINVANTVPATSVEDFKSGLAATVCRLSRQQLAIDVEHVNIDAPPGFSGTEPKLIALRRYAFARALELGKDPAIYDRVAVMSPREYFHPSVPPNKGNCIGTVDNHVVFCDIWKDGPFVGSLPTPVLLMHEFGHSYGWRHSNLWLPESGSNPIANGKEASRGDVFDIMGGVFGPVRGGQFHYFNPWYMSRVGWLLPGEIKDVTQTGGVTVYLRPLEDPPIVGGGDADPSAIRIRRNGPTTFPGPDQVPDHWTDYWIFWRRYEGVENGGEIAGAEACQAGPVIHLGTRTNMGRSILLDLVPDSSSTEPFADAPFHAGQTFTDGGMTVTFVGLDQGRAVLDIDLPTDYEAPEAPPSITFDVTTFPARGSSAFGDDWTFRVSANDPAGHGIDRVEFWLFPNEDDAIGHLTKTKLESETMIPVYPETFPRVHDNPPPVVNGPPPLYLTRSLPSQVLYVNGQYEWTTTLEASPGVPFPNGIYFLVVRAVPLVELGRANIAWRPFVIDQTLDE